MRAVGAVRGIKNVVSSEHRTCKKRSQGQKNSPIAHLVSQILTASSPQTVEKFANRLHLKGLAVVEKARRHENFATSRDSASWDTSTEANSIHCDFINEIFKEAIAREENIEKLAVELVEELKDRPRAKAGLESVKKVFFQAT